MKLHSSIPAIAVTFAILAVGCALVRLNAKHAIQEHQKGAARIAAATGLGLEKQLVGLCIAGIQVASDLAAHRSSDEFSAIGSQFSQQQPEGRISLISGSRVTAIYPKGTKAFTLSDLLPASTQSARDTAMAPDKTVLTGPIRASDGQLWLHCSVPLNQEPSVGLASVPDHAVMSLPLDRLLSAGGLQGATQAGYESAIQYANSDFPRASAMDTESAINQTIHTQQGPWVLTLAPREGWLPLGPVVAQVVLVLILGLISGIWTHDLTQRTVRHKLASDKYRQQLHAARDQLLEESRHRAELEKQVDHAGYHDVLTRLPNRRHLSVKLDSALRHARTKRDFNLAVLVINLDRFKIVNGSLGFAAGDRILLQCAQRLRDCLPNSDSVLAHLTADEFGVLLLDTSRSRAMEQAGQLSKALERPFTFEQQSIFLTASVGIALASSGYDHADNLLRGSGIALSKAKAEGGGRCVVFDSSAKEQIVTTQQTESELHLAIERNEFVLHYQPILSLSKMEMVGMEALVRWQHPLEGLIPPGRFIPVAEETGLVVPINRWVLKEVCRQARVWLDKLPENPKFYISSNLSARDLCDRGLPDYVAKLQQEANLPTGVLRLEVTESGLISNVATAAELLSEFRALGIPLLLDDFGTGYSSLSYLHRFKFDYLKIDRSFVSRLGGGKDEPDTIVRTIVNLAKDMGMQPIAEGIETPEQMKELQSLDCEYGQGYYFSKPVPSDAVEKLMLVGNVISGEGGLKWRSKAASA